MIAEAYMQGIVKKIDKDNEAIYESPQGIFRCIAKRSEVDSKFYCLDMTTYTDYGHVLDRECRLVSKEEKEDDVVRNFFVKSLMGIA